MRERDEPTRLEGSVQIDDASWWGALGRPEQAQD